MQAVPVNQFPLVDGLLFIRDQEWMPCFLERSDWDVLPLLILPDRRCAGPAPSVELQRRRSRAISTGFTFCFLI